MEANTLKKIITFLCSVPPESNLRFMLQLALAAEIPNDKREELVSILQDERPLEQLLLDEKLLTQILEANGKLGEAEDNMLFEAMESIGLVVPSDLSGAEVLLSEMSEQLVEDIKEIQSVGKVQDTSIVW